jgi:hypothetical protein
VNNPTLIIELSRADDVRKALDMIPEVALFKTSDEQQVWTDFMSVITEGPGAEIAFHAERISACSAARYNEGSAYFNSSGGHADFTAGRVGIRIGYFCASVDANRPDHTFFLSIDGRERGNDNATNLMFARILGAIVLDPDRPVLHAPTSFADFRGKMSAAMALVHCLLPLTR